MSDNVTRRYIFEPTGWEQDGATYVAEGRLVLSGKRSLHAIVRFPVDAFKDWLAELAKPDGDPDDLRLGVLPNQILRLDDR